MGDIALYVVLGVVVTGYFLWLYASTRPFKVGPDMSFSAIEARKDAEAARLAAALEPIVERAINEAIRKAFAAQRRDLY